eukprot:scaffold752_cov322-Pavlova_lutheri.AAC.59
MLYEQPTGPWIETTLRYGKVGSSLPGTRFDSSRSQGSDSQGRLVGQVRSDFFSVPFPGFRVAERVDVRRFAMGRGADFVGRRERWDAKVLVDKEDDGIAHTRRR